MSTKRKIKALQAALDNATLKQYKVSILTMALHNFTVMATSEEDAHAKVVTPEPGAPPAGRSAGTEGPVPFATRVRDMSVLEGKDVTLQVMMEEMMANMRKQATRELQQAAAPGLIQPASAIQIVKR